MEQDIWAKNITDTPDGIFRTTNGTADELIGIGRTIKAGFPCSSVDITNAKYDAIIDVGDGVLLRIQIKGTSNGMANFTGGVRSGKQIDKKVKSRTHKYTKKDCDIIMIVDGNDGDCYIMPVEDLKKWKTTKPLSKLQEYKENWDIFKNYAKKKKGRAIKKRSSVKKKGYAKK